MGFQLPTVETLRNEVKSRWGNGQFMGHTQTLPPRDYVGVPWVPYEEFMLAQIVHGVVNDVGLLNVWFPAHCTEANALHVHARSDHRVTVIEGGGFFVAERNGIVGAEPIAPGSIVFMPRNTKHTFCSGPDGLLIESLHAPFIGIEDEDCVAYVASAEPVDLCGLVAGDFKLPRLTEVAKE